MLSVTASRLKGDELEKKISKTEAPQKDIKTFLDSKDELEHKRRLKETMITVDVPVLICFLYCY